MQVIMHTNYRRKFPKHANEKYMTFRWHINEPCGYEQRRYWHQDRQNVRRHIRNEDWEGIYTRPRNSVRWDQH